MEAFRRSQTGGGTIGIAPGSERWAPLFAAPAVTDVLLTVGTDPLFFFDGIMATSGGPENVPSSDLAAVDDFVFAEPVPEPSPMSLVAFGSLSVLGATRFRSDAAAISGDPSTWPT
jgi:hypothetical protein